MSFEAKFPGTCSDCGGRIREGDLIETDSENGGYSHAPACPDDPAVALRPGETVCGSCFMVKPCPCDDGQAAS